MSLMAEQVVEEWMNREGFFTRRGVKEGVSEIDLLGVRINKGEVEAWHVEVQVSFRPVSYISKLSKTSVIQLGAKSASSAIPRTDTVAKSSVREWIDKKFDAEKKITLRDRCWPGLNWSRIFIHGKVRSPEELDLIRNQDITVMPFETILDRLCDHHAGQTASSAGTDIAEIVEFYVSKKSASR